MQGNIHRWGGTAPTYLEPGLASILPLKNVCSQLLVEWAGGRGGRVTTFAPAHK